MQYSPKMVAKGKYKLDKSLIPQGSFKVKKELVRIQDNNQFHLPAL